ncbi:GntR family transcriptional regulator [Pigmentiphaga soli]|uniref:GntR family transcriptional regulator n=1 Tax=Pigmentiphaga soli TaxID=1007095 RepID=A0ABP8HF08_9BURK
MSTGADRAYQQIRANIISGVYPAKSHLREKQLAEELNMSRTPIREALRRLAAEGVLDFSPQLGIFVPSWGVERVEQLYDLRSMLESNCAELAATRMTRADILDLQDLAERMEMAVHKQEPDALDRLTELNKAFHERIMTCSGNDRLKELTLNAINQLPILHRSFRRYEPAQWQRSLRHHRDLIDAFIVRDAHWAAAMMRAHILAGKYQLRLANEGDLPHADEAARASADHSAS